MLSPSCAEVSEAKRQIRKYLFICSVAFMMNYAAYGGLVFLQSSINIEEGLGTSGLVAVYATSAFSTIFIIPFLIDFKGAKTAIVAGEIGILIYTLANFYPRWYTIMPAALCHGFTEAASWAGASCYVTYLGEKYSELLQQQGKPSKCSITKESCVYRFFSIFYVFVYCSQVMGNALVSTILYALMGKGLESNVSSSVAVFELNASHYSAFNATADTLWKLCGSNLCHDNMDPKQLEKYEPNPLAVYCLLALFAGMQLAFTLVHALALPEIPRKRENSKSFRTSPPNNEELYKLCGPGTSSEVKAELKDTFLHIVSPLHLFIFPFVFYGGVYIAFAVAEFPRAFVSCTMGVEYVGFVVVVYGLSSMTMSATSTKLIPLLGRNVCVTGMYLMHGATFLLCLLWVPSRSGIWIVFLASFCLGCCDGIMTNITQGMFAAYFEDKLAIAFSVKNFATNLGIVAGSAWSEVLCVDVKIYILFGFLLLSMGTYVVAERLHKKRAKDTNDCRHNTSETPDEEFRRVLA